VHAYVAVRSGYPSLITVHGVQREDFKYLWGWQHKLHGWLQGVLIEGYCVAHARHAIVISPYLVQALPALQRATLHPIPNPVPDSYFHLTPETDPLRILYAGVIVPRKRLLDSLAALCQVRERVPGAQLRVAGAASDPDYDRECRRYVAEHGLQANVTFLGPLSEAALAEEYRRASLLLLTSIQETAPMVILQAMAAGIAVVSTRVGGVPDLVEEGRTALLTAPGDVAATAAALERLLRHPQECAQMGALGRAFAREHYAVERVAEATERVYRTVAQG
jgi:glycosyltransferase involved in cell wall biosynthesis